MSSGFKVSATSGSGGGGPKAPPGNHPAVLVAVIDLGTQWVDGYQLSPGKNQRRVYFVWELTAEAKGPGANHVIGIDLTMSFNEKSKLRKWVEAWTGQKFSDGADFDVSTLLGKDCLLNVIESKGYPKIDGIGAMPKGMKAPPALTKPVAWSLGDHKAGMTPDVPSWLPWIYGEKVSDVILKCTELGGDGGKGDQRQSYSEAAGQPVGGDKPPPRHTAATGAGMRDEEFWVEVNAEGDPVKMTRSELAVWLPANSHRPADINVCPKSGTANDWKPAKDYGFADEGF